jgi:hypothetical protein
VTGTAAVERADQRSWLQRLVTWLDQLPGPIWVVYLILLVGGSLLWHVAAWSKGDVAFGTVDPPSLYWGFLGPALLWIAAFLERGTAASFAAFRPILTLPADEIERLRRTLMAIPARPAWIITALSAVATVVSVLAEPDRYIEGLPPVLIVGLFISQTVYTSILFQLLYWLVRQTTAVRRSLAHSVAIDVFRPGPLNAFATLTARPGIAISLLVAAGVPITSASITAETFLVSSAPYLVLPPVIAILAFVLPLTGAHARLVEQKARLRDEAERRVEATLGELNRDVDGRDMTRADGLNKALGSLVIQRDILAKLPTWPWSTATLRTFVSALLLPIVLFLIQQALSRVI